MTPDTTPLTPSQLAAALGRLGGLAGKGKPKRRTKADLRRIALAGVSGRKKAALLRKKLAAESKENVVKP